MRFSANLNAASSSSLLSSLEFSTICSEGRQGYLFFQWGDSNSQGGYCTARLLQKTFHPSFLVLFLIMIIEENKGKKQKLMNKSNETCFSSCKPTHTSEMKLTHPPLPPPYPHFIFLALKKKTIIIGQNLKIF